MDKSLIAILGILMMLSGIGVGIYAIDQIKKQSRNR